MAKTFCRTQGSSWAGLLALSFLCVACSSEGPERDGSALGNTNVLRGELVIYIADFDDGTTRSSTTYDVDGNELDERLLEFENDPDLTAAREIEVRGTVQRRSLRGGRVPACRERLEKRSTGRRRPYPAKRSHGLRRHRRRRELTAAEARQAALRHERRRRLGQAVLPGSLVRPAGHHRRQVVGPLNYTMCGCDTSALADALRAADARHLQSLPLVLRAAAISCVQLVGSRVGGLTRPARGATPGTTRARAASSWCRSPATTSGCSTRRRSIAAARRSRRPERLHAQRVRRLATTRWAAAAAT